MGQMVNPGVPVHNDSLGENNVKSASTFENPTKLISFPGSIHGFLYSLKCSLTKEFSLLWIKTFELRYEAVFPVVSNLLGVFAQHADPRRKSSKTR